MVTQAEVLGTELAKEKERSKALELKLAESGYKGALETLDRAMLDYLAAEILRLTQQLEIERAALPPAKEVKVQ